VSDPQAPTDLVPPDQQIAFEQGVAFACYQLWSHMQRTATDLRECDRFDLVRIAYHEGKLTLQEPI